MQIKPDRYYLEMVMHQTLGKNYGFSNYMPNVWVYGQLPPQDNNDEIRSNPSPCPSNWSDDLYIVDDNNDENKGQTDQPTKNSTTITGTRVLQDLLADTRTTLRLPQTMPRTLKIQKQNGKTKQKTRLPYVTWTWKKSQKQDGPEQK